MQLKQFTTIMISTLIVLTSQLQGLGVQVGPFSLNLSGGGPVNRPSLLDDPICRAIANQNLLEMVVEWEAVSDQGDSKIITKSVTIEPYLFGLNSAGQPVLKGNIVSEKVVREVAVTYNPDEKRPDNKNGFFSGMFKSKAADKDVDTINLRKVTEVRVVEGSHFDAPDKYEEIFKGDVVQVICTVAPDNDDED